MTTVAEARVPLTLEGLTRLREELAYLTDVKRLELAASLEQGRENNLSTEDDPGFEFARQEQASVEERILTLADMIARAEIIDETAARHSPIVQLGSTVVVKPDDGPAQTYHLVGSIEVDVSRGKISDSSPVGRALLGHRPGERVEVSTPNGSRGLTIVSLA